VHRFSERDSFTDLNEDLQMYQHVFGLLSDQAG
jgi:hypothetical protein